MSKLIICQGIQGSGKTTFAKQWVQENSTCRVRWNNDDIRNMLGDYWIPSREELISKMRRGFLKEAMLEDYDIIMDDMNLNPDTVEAYEDLAEINNYEFIIKLFNTPLETCIERDSKREKPIGKDVIIETYNKYKEYLDAPETH